MAYAVSVKDPLHMALGYLGFGRNSPKGKNASSGPARITEPMGKPASLPLLILSPGQRVDLLNKERNRLLNEYRHAHAKTSTGQMADLRKALMNVTHELMRRQLAVQS